MESYELSHITLRFDVWHLFRPFKFNELTLSCYCLSGFHRILSGDLRTDSGNPFSVWVTALGRLTPLPFLMLSVELSRVGLERIIRGPGKLGVDVFSGKLVQHCTIEIIQYTKDKIMVGEGG